MIDREILETTQHGACWSQDAWLVYEEGIVGICHAKNTVGSIHDVVVGKQDEVLILVVPLNGPVQSGRPEDILRALMDHHLWVDVLESVDRAVGGVVVPDHQIGLAPQGANTGQGSSRVVVGNDDSEDT